MFGNRSISPKEKLLAVKEYLSGYNVHACQDTNSEILSYDSFLD